MGVTPRIRLLWWIACAAEALAAVLETLERAYLKAASLYCLSLIFLLLATGGTEENQTRSRKILLYLLVFTSIGLLIYRVATNKLLG